MALFRKDLWEIISFVDFILNPDQLQTMSVTGLCDRHYFLLLKKNVHLVIAVLKLYIFFLFTRTIVMYEELTAPGHVRSV